jgi:hypothetical protein
VLRAEDVKENELSLQEGFRLLSSYPNMSAGGSPRWSADATLCTLCVDTTTKRGPADFLLAGLRTVTGAEGGFGSGARPLST